MLKHTHTTEQKQKTSTLFETLNARQPLSEHTTELVSNLFKSCHEFYHYNHEKHYTKYCNLYRNVLLNSTNNELDYDEVKEINKFLNDFQLVLNSTFKAEKYLREFKTSSYSYPVSEIEILLNNIQLMLNNHHNATRINSNLTLEIIHDNKKSKAYKLVSQLNYYMILFNDIKDDYLDLQRELLNQKEVIEHKEFVKEFRVILEKEKNKSNQIVDQVKNVINQESTKKYNLDILNNLNQDQEKIIKESVELFVCLNVLIEQQKESNSFKYFIEYYFKTVDLNQPHRELEIMYFYHSTLDMLRGINDLNIFNSEAKNKVIIDQFLSIDKNKIHAAIDLLNTYIDKSVQLVTALTVLLGIHEDNKENQLKLSLNDTSWQFEQLENVKHHFNELLIKLYKAK